jgi:hypothetical protein
MSETAVLSRDCVHQEIVRVCCHCRRVRSADGQWVRPSATPPGPLSHGICRPCFLIHYPEFPLPDGIR